MDKFLHGTGNDIIIKCAKCGKFYKGTVETPQAFEGSIRLLAGLNNVGDLNRKLEYAGEEHMCNCLESTRLEIVVPSWYGEVLHRYKKSFEQYRKSHPL